MKLMRNNVGDYSLSAWDGGGGRRRVNSRVMKMIVE